MTVGDYPKYLAVGYLVNQNILKDRKKILEVIVEDDINTVVVRTTETTSYEISEKNKIKTSGCANGTIFDNVIEEINSVILDKNFSIRTENIFKLYKLINEMPSLYLKSGAIHGCVLCSEEEPIAYFEDVGRHNAIDKLAGFIFLENIEPRNKFLYTTGRLTSEMVIKTVLMRIPILASRSGFTAWGVELANKCNLTMLGRLRGRRYNILSSEYRVINDC